MRMAFKVPGSASWVSRAPGTAPSEGDPALGDRDGDGVGEGGDPLAVLGHGRNPPAGPVGVERDQIDARAFARGHGRADERLFDLVGTFMRVDDDIDRRERRAPEDARGVPEPEELGDADFAPERVKEDQ